MRVGIIGSNWGRMHVGACRAAGLEVHVLCGRSPEKTARVAREEGIPHATTDVRALCEACDLVVVVSPDADHRAHVELAIDAGRHVLCEKPLTRTVEEAEALVARAAARPDLVCAVGFPFRALPGVAALKRWLHTRTPMTSLEVHVRNSFVGKEPSSTEMVGDSGDMGGVSHPLDALLFLFGLEVRSVEASLAGRPVARASIALELENGARAQLVHRPSIVPGIWGRWSLAGVDWEAGFEAGYEPSLSGWSVSTIRIFEYGRWGDLSVPAVRRGRDPWAEAHAEIARRWVAAIRGGDRAGLPSLEDGLRVQRVLDMAMTSERDGRRVGRQG